MRSVMAAVEPNATEEAPPSVAAPPTISNTGRAYLIRPDVGADFSATVFTPAPRREGDGLADTAGLDRALLGLGLAVDL